jgi:hypothetical protein
MHQTLLDCILPQPMEGHPAKLPNIGPADATPPRRLRIVGVSQSTRIVDALIAARY